MCLVDTIEACDFQFVQTRTARKAYLCSECRRVIAPKEQYQELTLKFDGLFERHRTCRHCVAATAWLIRHCGGWAINGLREDLLDHYEEGAPDWEFLKWCVDGVTHQWAGEDYRLMDIQEIPARA